MIPSSSPNFKLHLDLNQNYRGGKKQVENKIQLVGSIEINGETYDIRINKHLKSGDHTSKLEQIKKIMEEALNSFDVASLFEGESPETSLVDKKFVNEDESSEDIQVRDAKTKGPLKSISTWEDLGGAEEERTRNSERARGVKTIFTELRGLDRQGTVEHEEPRSSPSAASPSPLTSKLSPKPSEARSPSAPARKEVPHEQEHRHTAEPAQVAPTSTSSLLQPEKQKIKDDEEKPQLQPQPAKETAEIQKKEAEEPARAQSEPKVAKHVSFSEAPPSHKQERALKALSDLAKEIPDFEKFAHEQTLKLASGNLEELNKAFQERHSSFEERITGAHEKAIQTGLSEEAVRRPVKPELKNRFRQAGDEFRQAYDKAKADQASNTRKAELAKAASASPAPKIKSLAEQLSEFAINKELAKSEIMGASTPEALEEIKTRFETQVSLLEEDINFTKDRAARREEKNNPFSDQYKQFEAARNEIRETYQERKSNFPSTSAPPRKFVRSSSAAVPSTASSARSAPIQKTHLTPQEQLKDDFDQLIQNMKKAEKENEADFALIEKAVNKEEVANIEHRLLERNKPNAEKSITYKAQDKTLKALTSEQNKEFIRLRDNYKAGDARITEKLNQLNQPPKVAESVRRASTPENAPSVSAAINSAAETPMPTAAPVKPAPQRAETPAGQSAASAAETPMPTSAPQKPVQARESTKEGQAAAKAAATPMHAAVAEQSSIEPRKEALIRHYEKLLEDMKKTSSANLADYEKVKEAKDPSEIERAIKDIGSREKNNDSALMSLNKEKDALGSAFTERNAELGSLIQEKENMLKDLVQRHQNLSLQLEKAPKAPSRPQSPERVSAASSQPVEPKQPSAAAEIPKGVINHAADKFQKYFDEEFAKLTHEFESLKLASTVKGDKQIEARFLKVRNESIQLNRINNRAIDQFRDDPRFTKNKRSIIVLMVNINDAKTSYFEKPIPSRRIISDIPTQGAGDTAKAESSRPAAEASSASPASAANPVKNPEVEKARKAIRALTDELDRVHSENLHDYQRIRTAVETADKNNRPLLSFVPEIEKTLQIIDQRDQSLRTKRSSYLNDLGSAEIPEIKDLEENFAAKERNNSRLIEEATQYFQTSLVRILGGEEESAFQEPEPSAASAQLKPAEQKQESAASPQVTAAPVERPVQNKSQGRTTVKLTKRPAATASASTEQTSASAASPAVEAKKPGYTSGKITRLPDDEQVAEPKAADQLPTESKSGKQSIKITRRSPSAASVASPAPETSIPPARSDKARVQNTPASRSTKSLARLSKEDEATIKSYEQISKRLEKELEKARSKAKKNKTAYQKVLSQQIDRFVAEKTQLDDAINKLSAKQKEGINHHFARQIDELATLNEQLGGPARPRAAPLVNSSTQDLARTRSERVSLPEDNSGEHIKYMKDSARELRESLQVLKGQTEAVSKEALSELDQRFQILFISAQPKTRYQNEMALLQPLYTQALEQGNFDEVRRILDLAELVVSDEVDRVSKL